MGKPVKLLKSKILKLFRLHAKTIPSCFGSKSFGSINLATKRLSQRERRKGQKTKISQKC